MICRKTRCVSACLIAIFIGCSYTAVVAQTEHDGIMMNKRQWCNGASYMSSKWTDYWEGSFKRHNDNIGAITTRTLMYMTNYGITSNLNVLGGLPYVWTSASKGTLHEMSGLQDASLFVKWRPLKVNKAFGKLSLFTVAGFSTPVNNYAIDFLPLSIGLGSTSVTGRITGDYQKGIFFTTASAAYAWRSNVKLDRNSYYTEQIHLINEVKMPNAAMYSLSAGIRTKYLITEAMINRNTTIGGFDIRKNDMPFVSNRMNSTSIGLHAKYTLPNFTHIELIGDLSHVVAGRNVGQATSIGGGLYYLFSFKSKKSLSKNL